MPTGCWAHKPRALATSPRGFAAVALSWQKTRVQNPPLASLREFPPKINQVAPKRVHPLPPTSPEAPAFSHRAVPLHYTTGIIKIKLMKIKY